MCNASNCGIMALLIVLWSTELNFWQIWLLITIFSIHFQMTTEKKEEKKSFEEMWADAKKNSGDFNTWTSLLTHVEQNVLLIGELIFPPKFRRCHHHYLGFLRQRPKTFSYLIPRHSKRSRRVSLILRTLPLLLRLLEKTRRLGAEKCPGRRGTCHGKMSRNFRERPASHSFIGRPLATVHKLHQIKSQGSRGWGRAVAGFIQTSYRCKFSADSLLPSSINARTRE